MQSGEQACFAAMRQREERVFIKPAKRAAQKYRHRHIIGRIERNIQSGQHIGDRQLLQQHHAVGAGDVNRAAFQCTAQLRHKAIAFAHQNQNIAGFYVLGLVL